MEASTVVIFVKFHCLRILVAKLRQHLFSGKFEGKCKGKKIERKTRRRKKIDLKLIDYFATSNSFHLF